MALNYTVDVTVNAQLRTAANVAERVVCGYLLGNQC
jgi:hypothetical protein